MSYVKPSELSESIGSCASCGPSCGCKTCKDKFHGFGERYIKDEDDDDRSDADNRTAGYAFALGEVPGTPSPVCDVVDGFAFDNANVPPVRLGLLDAIAKKIVSREGGPDSVRAVTFTGHTDTVGSAEWNLALGRRRAEQAQALLWKRLDTIKPGLSSKIAPTIVSRGESMPLPGPPEKSRRVEICFSASSGPAPSPVVTDRFKIVVKSYIARMGSATGSMRTIPRCIPFDPLNIKLKGLALATDRMMSENPLTDLLDKRYRLYSERTFAVSCRDGKLISVLPSGFTTDVGLECPPIGPCLTPPPLTATVTTSGASSPSIHRFSWMAEGRPALAAEPAFQAVCPRTSRFIWHKVDGEIDCSGPKPIVRVKLVGSQFPSHRVFVNGKLVASVRQGGFSNLWIADPTNLSRVR